MLFRLSTWRPRHLLAAWSAYWLAFALLAIGPAVPAVWRATRPGAQGSVSASFGDGLLRLTVTQDAITAWTGAMGFGALTLILGAPPLLLWIFWLRSQRRRTRPTTEPV